MQYMKAKATLILNDRFVAANGVVVARRIHRLPQPDAARPHGYVYQLHCGTPTGQTLVRYDNETGKGDHVHRGDREYPYSFATLERLLTDFEAEIQPYLGA